jgi:O-antigen/teichoic acid export membrane protein
MSFGRLLARNIMFRVLNIAVNLIIIILLTRLMGTAGYGVLSLLVANASVFSLVSCLGSESGITYHYASGSMQRSKIFSIIYSIIFFQLALLGITEIIHFSITGHYWLLRGHELKFLLWGLLYLFSLTVIDKYTAFLNSHHLYTLANKIIFFSNLIALLLFGGLFYLCEQQELFFYLQVFILTTFIQALMLFALFHIKTGQPLRFSATDKNDRKLFFSYSFIVFITNVIQFLAYRVDYWLLDYFRDSESLGLYALAMRICQLFWVIPILFAGIIFPRVADTEIKFSTGDFLKLLRITHTGLLVIMIAAAFTAGWFIPFFFGRDFSHSLRVFLYLLPGFYLFSINILLAAYFAGKSKLKINLTASSICFILVFALDLWLIPEYGIEGAAIASCIAYAAASVYSIVRFSRMEKKSFFSLFIIQKGDWHEIKSFFNIIVRQKSGLKML